MCSRKTLSRVCARPAGILVSVVPIVLGAALLGIFGPTAVRSAASPSASIALLAIDADPTGNSPRYVGTIEQCVSANVGQPAQIDIVIPGTGVPAERGIGAYQFSILYDPGSIWIAEDDGSMLLAQAAGSNVISIADPRPDRNGVYVSWGVDFGPSGIEPAGASETGPGVIARITLLPQSEGVSTLTLRDVLVIDDASNRITLGSIQPATIKVGQSCSNESVTPPTRTPSLGAGTTALPPSTPAAETFPRTGGGPAPDSSNSLFIVAGLLAVLGGVSLLIPRLSTNGSKGRGP